MNSLVAWIAIIFCLIAWPPGAVIVFCLWVLDCIYATLKKPRQVIIVSEKSKPIDETLIDSETLSVLREVVKKGGFVRAERQKDGKMKITTGN